MPQASYQTGRSTTAGRVATSRRRAPSGSSRTTGAPLVGAMFQVGSSFGTGPFVSNRRANASAGKKLAYRPHITRIWDWLAD
jgi:hypothetical protein